MGFGGAVARNFAYLLAAQIVAGLVGLASMAYLARTLGPETFGILGFGTAVIAYFGHLVVLGSDFYGSREIARHPEDAAWLVSRIVGLRLFTSVAALVLFGLVIWLIDQPATVKIVMAIQGIGLIVTLIVGNVICAAYVRRSPRHGATTRCGGPASANSPAPGSSSACRSPQPESPTRALP
jgi:O-antigen/teichoic acid export membrane protein